MFVTFDFNDCSAHTLYILGPLWANEYALKIRTFFFNPTMLIWPFIVLRIKKKQKNRF